jgi:streptomycin 6-kinase
MRSSADREIFRRDEALPELATLLDPEAFVEAMKPHMPDIESARVVYVKYKARTNCLAGYKVMVGGREVDAYAKTFGPDAEVKIGNALKRKSKAGDLGSGRIVLEGRAISAMFFPNDDKLKQLGKLSKDRRKVIKDIVPDRPDLWDGELRMLRYKPERRYVAQLCVDGEPRATVKFYRKDDYRTARRNAGTFDEAFKTTGPFRVAGMLGSSDRYSAVAFEWREGRSLGEAITNPSERKDALEIAGAALAELHAQPSGVPADGLRRLDREDEGEILASLVEPLVFNSPDLESKIRSLARTLAQRLRREPSPARPIHGDFYEDQVLIGGGTATLLDLDEAVLGDPASDLGLFIAHLEKDAMLGLLEREAVVPAAERLLEGYRSWGTGMDPELVRFYTAVGLFRLAPHPFRTRHPRWPELTREFLDRAERLLRPAHSMSA